MSIEHVRMRVAFLVIALAASCGVRRNESVCLDGHCPDPSKPFCDEGGEIGGEPGACVSVECTQGEFAACRDDGAVTCNNTGDNYDVAQCPLGCADGVGCRECSEESHCAATAGICDQETYSCRGCRLDSECSSNVCDLDTGKCLPEAGVLYASPDGSSAEPCTKASPCSLVHAFGLANAALPTIRMLPGAYATAFTLTNKKLMIIGVGATLTTQSTTVIGDGADITIRGLEIVLAGGEMQCKATASPSLPRARTELRDVMIREPANYPLRTLDCIAKITNSEIRGVNMQSIAIFQRNSSVEVDRTLFKGATGRVWLSC